MASSLWALRLSQDDVSEAQKNRFRRSVAIAATLVQADLIRALAVVDGLELLIRTTGQVAGFDKLAQDLMLRQPLVTAIALAPSGVIRQGAPMDAMGSLFGKQIFDDAVTRADLQEAVQKHSAVIAQPQALIGGGIGTVARIPVFKNATDPDKAPALWGFVLVQVKLPDVLARLASAGVTVRDERYTLSALDTGTGRRVAFFPLPAPSLGAVATASIELPQRRWTLSVELPRGGGSDSLMPRFAAGLASVLVGLACTAGLFQRRARQARRSFYRRSMPPLLCDDGLDQTHRALDGMRHLPGWAVLLVVRWLAPQQPGAQANTWIRALLREDDLLVPLGGQSFLVLAHSLPEQVVAARVRDRLVGQAQDLEARGQMLVSHRLFSQPQVDTRLMFAEAVADMHLDTAAHRRRAVPLSDLNLAEV